MPDDTFTLDDKKLTQTLQRLGAVFGDEAAGMIARAAGKVASEIEYILRYYPPERENLQMPVQYTRTRPDGSTYQSKFKSFKHQMGFFGRLKSGAIKVPYTRRTGKGIQASVTSEVIRTDDGAEVRAGTNLAEAKYVVGDEETEQAAIHKGWWEPWDQRVQDEDNQARMVEVFVDDIEVQIAEALR